MGPRVLGIVGSYRKGGTIDSAVSEVLAAAAARGAVTAKLYLLDQRIEFCTNCRRCTQVAGPDPGPCVHQDDMAGIIAAIEKADALVIGAPVNFGNVNALTQRFLERLVCYAYWPWGQAGPAMRKKGGAPKKAVLITSTAMPAIMARFATGAIKTLKKAAAAVGSTPSDTLFLGLAAMRERQPLDPRTAEKARRAGLRLVE